MISYCDTSDLGNEDKVRQFNSYDELIKEISPKATFNGWFRSVEVHTEDELNSMDVTPHPPPGMENYVNDANYKELYNLNFIPQYIRDRIPKSWGKIRWVVGIHYDRHFRGGENHNEFLEKSWSVIGVVFVL